MDEKEYTALFEKLIRSRGWGFQDSSDREDMELHIDAFVELRHNGRPIRMISVELKGKKYTSRATHGRPECMCQYIEFMNVNGDNGWLLGEADYIAILGENEKFYLIAREDMIKFCEDMFNVNLHQDLKKIESDLLALDCWVNSSYEARHKLYRRRDRQDIVTQISMDDVKQMAKIII